MREGPLQILDQALGRHADRVTEIIRGVVRPYEEGGVQFVKVEEAGPVVYGLVGRQCERTARNRGREVFVAPWLEVGDDLWAWIGYQEEWNRTSGKGRGNRIAFRSLGFTCYFGRDGEAEKVQMFRAEWMGQSNSESGAANPHWHFDGLEAVKRKSREAEQRKRSSQELRDEESRRVKDFTPQETSLRRQGFEQVIETQRISRVHFANGANWWKQGSTGGHLYIPQSTAEIQHWLSNLLSYLSREMSGAKSR